MVSSPSTSRITIFAQSAGQTEGNKALTWSVDIHVNDAVVSRSLVLKNPLTDKQTAECRWYLEKYVPLSPYTTTRAREAAGPLKTYAHSLATQLQLAKVTDGIPQDPSSPRHTLILEVLEGELEKGSSRNSVHQLHWELLEECESWAKRPGLEVIVRRSIRHLEKAFGGINRIESWRGRTDSTPSVNVLLVIARDTSGQEDVNPTVASKILMKLRQDLQKSGSAIRLNVEIVRPGTLLAFTQHLEASEMRNGPRYFHIVHFDLHGKVASSNKSPIELAWLDFARPGRGSEGLKPERASKVASLLRDHKIPFVVLNACESARANSGDDANIAKVFESAGVKSVLAMSFKVMDSAASLFLSKFYHELVIGHTTFSAAAQRGRDALRASPIRSARLQLELPLVDWFVPVLYTCGHELMLVPPRQNLKENERADSVELSSETVILPAPDLVGRDFDLLRFEKELLSSNIVYLHGRAGVGKSALLEYAHSVWEDTSFVDASIYVNFEKDQISTADELAAIILRQLFRTQGHDYQGQLWTVGEDTLQSCDSDAMMSLVVEIMSNLRVAMIFDSMQESHPMFAGETTVHALKKDNLTQINNCLKRFISLSSKPESPESQIFLVFVDRRADSEGLSKQLSYDLKGNAYELPGLSTIHAIQLGQAILREAGLDIDSWTHQDHNQLELIIGLLQGLPGSLIEILPRAGSEGLPWNQFYDFVQRGALAMHTALEDSTWMSHHSFFQEIEYHFQKLAGDFVASLLILGLYWHEGPFAALFGDWMVNSGVCEIRPKADLIVLLARDRGFLDTQPLNRISWVHPSFTIYARIMACSIASKGGVVVQGAKGSDLKPETSLIRSRSLSRAARFATCVLSGIAPAISEKKIYDDFIAFFVFGLDKRFFLSVSEMFLGNAGKDMRSHHETAFQNIISCINICVGVRQPFPLSKWPDNLFTMFTDHIRNLGTTIEATLFAERYEYLLNSFLLANGGKAVRPKYQNLVLNIVNYLTATHKVEVHLPVSRHDEFSNLACEIVAESEARYGTMTEPLAVLQKSTALRYATTVLLSDGQEEKAEETWTEMLNLAESVFGKGEGTGSLLNGIDPALVQQQMAAVQDAMPNRSTGKSRMPFQLNGVLEAGRAQHLMYKDFFALKKLEAKKGFLGDDGKVLPQSKGMLSIHQQRLAAVSEAYGAINVPGLEEHPRWKAQHENTIDYLERQNDPEERLVGIENAGASVHGGDWVTAVNHHRALSAEAAMNLNYEDALAHIRAIEEIHAKNPSTSTDELMKGIESFKIQIEVGRSAMSMAFPDSGESTKVDPQLQLAQLDAQIKAMENSGAPAEAVQMCKAGRDLIADGIDHGDLSLGNGKANSGQTKDWLQAQFRRIGNQSFRNPNFLSSIISVVNQVRDIWRDIDAATKVRDYDLAIKHVTRLESLSANEATTGLVDPANLVKIKAHYKLQAEWFKVFDAFQVALSARDFDVASKRLAQMREIKERDVDKGSQRQKSAQIEELTRLLKLHRLIGDVQKAGGVVEAGRRIKVIVDADLRGEWSLLEGHEGVRGALDNMKKYAVHS